VFSRNECAAGNKGTAKTDEKVKGGGNSKGINGKGGRNVLYGSLGMDSRDLVAAEYGDALFTRIRYYSASPVGKRSIVTSVSVCLSVCLCWQSLCERISGTVLQFSAISVHVTYVARSSGGVAIHYVLPVLWMTS